MCDSHNVPKEATPCASGERCCGACKGKSVPTQTTTHEETVAAHSTDPRPDSVVPPTHLEANWTGTPNLDTVTTFGAGGRRVMPQPTLASGPFYRARSLVGILLIALYLALPWIPVGHAPAIFLDLATRRFHLFGLTFLTQDLWLAFFVVSGLGFGLFALTALWGRIWCGWACPLTVFLDIVRRIERWIEGDGPERKRRAAEPATPQTLLRNLFKHSVLALFATLVAHGLLAYFVSVPELLRMMAKGPSAAPRAFALVAVTTGVLWFCFAWFREQFCIVLCPYGRLQSVLTDEHTLVIGYDSQRGEPRGKASKAASPIGDCVDCQKCVHACPTGIDIRHGLQLECIGCAACIDACNGVMEKLHRPKNLIRYDSLAGLKGQPRRLWRPRLTLYVLLLLLGATAASIAVSTLRSANVSFTRMTGSPYFVEQGNLRNQFLLRILNKRPDPSVFTLSVEGDVPPGFALQGVSHEEVQGWGEIQHTLISTVPLSAWEHERRLTLVVTSSKGEIVARKPLTILGPNLAALNSLENNVIETK